MNWPLAIARNRTALLGVVAAIIALIGGRVLRQAQDEGGLISRNLRNAALALLRPAEAAARRLIVVSARGLSLAPRPAPAFAGGAGPRRAERDGAAPSGLARPPAFRLFDRDKRFGRAPRPRRPAVAPRIRTFWGPEAAAPFAPPAASQTDPAAPVDAARLRLRTAALERALADLPHQARRLARWRARRVGGPGGREGSPLRLGHPPGWRKRAGREVDAVLRECHLLALDALTADTS